MFSREDNSYNEMRGRATLQWLDDLSNSDDTVNKSGAKLTMDYIEYLNKKINELQHKNKIKDEYLKKLKSKY